VRRGALPERDGAVLAPLAVEPEGGGPVEENVVAAEPDRLGHARPGVVEDGEEDRVALAAPGGAIRCGEEGVDLLPGEVAEDGPVEALGGDGEDALGDGERGGVPKGGVPEERADRREAEVAGARAVAPGLLEVVEEREHDGGIEVLDRERGRGTSGALLRETQEDLEGVAVARDGLGAGAALGDETRAEEILEERGEREPRGRNDVRSGSWPANCSNLRDVTAISSGTAERYQYVSLTLAWPR